MKRFTAIALCFVLTAAVLTACRGKKPEETAGTTIMPTASATAEATEPATMATMPTILPTAPTDDTGIMDDATGGTGETDAGASRSRRPMPIQ